MILSGDFNIDILSIKQRLIFKNYLEKNFILWFVPNN